MALKDTIYMEDTSNGADKYYKMEDLGNGHFKATHGSIGNKRARNAVEDIYPISKWDEKFNEKTRKKNYKVISTTPNNGTAKPAQKTGKKLTLKPEIAKKFDLLEKLVKNINNPAFSKVSNLAIIQSVKQEVEQTGVLEKEQVDELNKIFLDAKQYVV